MPDRAIRAAMGRLVRRNMGVAAAINAAMSLAFFLAVFGRPGRPLAFGAPDGLALDFLPQAVMVALMSALVPPLVERRALAGITGHAPRPVRAIVLAAAGFAALGLVLGLCLAGAALALALPPLPGWPVLALKLAFGAALGAVITRAALRRQAERRTER